MTITIEINPVIEAALARQAAIRGMDVPAYATALLEAAADTAADTVRSEKNQTPGEFEKALDRIAQFSNEIPALPDEAFSRESFYQDCE